MNIKDALSILGVEAGTATPESIKLAYRRAAQKNHPDRNPSSEHMMKLINVAYDLVVSAPRKTSATPNAAMQY